MLCLYNDKYYACKKGVCNVTVTTQSMYVLDKRGSLLQNKHVCNHGTSTTYYVLTM